MQLVVPSLEYLPSYAAALETGWSPNKVMNVSAEQLAAIRENPVAFVAGLLLQGGTVALPDGTAVPKLPFMLRWMWDEDFCGTISLRWQEGTDTLPPHVLGHIGYAVVPWKRGRGHATKALRTMLAEAARIGLRRIEISTDPDNLASQRVIAKNGGRFVETFVNAHFGLEPHLRYVVDLNRAEVRTTMP
ncbi:MAG: GNAT family N-acetyltransferase [Hyphomicrobiaceae bacterium]